MGEGREMKEEAPFLKVTSLTKQFGGVRAVDLVSFDMKKGEILGVIGPNGSGKTTLVNLITGFVKPDAGKVFYQGKDITGMMPHRIADLGIARAFQMVKPFYQLPAFKNLIIPLFSPRVKRLAGGKYCDPDAIAIDLLEEGGFERESFVPFEMASGLFTISNRAIVCNYGKKIAEGPPKEVMESEEVKKAYLGSEAE